MRDSKENTEKIEESTTVPSKKKVRKAKGTAKILPITATLITTHTLLLYEFLTEENKNKGSLDLASLFQAHIDERVLFDKLKNYALISSTMMALADVFEKLISSPDPKNLTLMAYFFARQVMESSNAEKSMGIKKFNEEFFRTYFKDIKKVPAYRKKYIKILSKSNNNDRSVQSWEEETFNAIKRDYRRLLKLGKKRQEKEQPKLYKETLSIIEKFFAATT
jgi:hypothetical protein